MSLAARPTLHIDVLPTPGGPTNRKLLAGRFTWPPPGPDCRAGRGGVGVGVEIGGAD